MKKTATVNKQPGKAKSADPLVNRRFDFESNDVIYTGTIIARVCQGSYLVRLADGDHVLSPARMDKLGFVFKK
jgi:hypothetical protein